MSAARTTVLLFDLGGVLIDNRTFQELPGLLNEPMADDVLRARWLASPAVQRFERGEIEPAEFGALFVEEWGLRIPPRAFLGIFSRWPRGLFAGAGEMLVKLRRRHTIALLSNCNVLHWRRMQPVLLHADHAFSSHQCGLVKPDAAIFLHVIKKLGRAERDIIFFDDSASNISAAQTVGMRAYQTIGFESLTRTISALGLEV